MARVKGHSMTAASRPVALITGATRGIGRAIASELARTHHVIIGGRSRAAVDAVVAELGDASGFVADLAELSSIADRAAMLPELDVLVHSAGLIGPHEPIAEVNVDDLLQVFTVNVAAVHELTRITLPGLRARSGSVITINSGSGFTSHPKSSVYSASKFALRAWSDALRDEERAHGVRVTSIHPGRVATDMQQELRAMEGGEYREDDYLTPAAVAQAVRLAVETPRGGNIDELQIRPQ